MKKLVAGLLVAAVATVSGCNTSPPGGPGASGSSSRVSTYPPAETHHPVAGNPPPTADTHHVPAAEPPRGPGAPAIGGSDTFRLTAPTGLTAGVTLKQGEKKEVTIGISRGSTFKENVKLEVKNPPKGLTVTPEKPSIAAGDSQAKVMIEAAKDAPLGTHTVEITGVPDNGASATVDLTVKVEKGGEK
jgi:hypothetical protein